MRRTYTVRIVRPVFQRLSIEVEAWNRGSAIRKAAGRAQKALEDQWITCESSVDAYAPHVEAVLDHEEVYENDPNPRRKIASFRAGTGECDTNRYILLAADTEARVGRLLTQPWFNQADATLQTELCSDWLEPVEFIIENDGIEGSEGAAEDGELQVHDNVIEFPDISAKEEIHSRS